MLTGCDAASGPGWSSKQPTAQRLCYLKGCWYLGAACWYLGAACYSVHSLVVEHAKG